MSAIEAIAMEFCRRGGKRLRPRLCKAAFEHASGGAPSIGDIDALCDAVECFHKASLIHDDIQDGDEERYGKPATWKEHGVAVAIAAGDWLVAHGYGLIAGSGFANAMTMLEETIRSHVALCEGQGDDLIGPKGTGRDSQFYISVCERKTGEAFALAAELGALAAGVDGAPYRRYGLDFGVLFQLKDDLADGEVFEGAAGLAEDFERRLAADELHRKLGEWYR